MNKIREIFDYWNNIPGLIKHRDIERFRTSISARLKVYSVDELKESISNYAKIINSDDYYFSYRWQLKDFLLRGIDRFLNINKPFEIYKKGYGSPYGKPKENITKIEDNFKDRFTLWKNSTPEEKIELEKKWKDKLDGKQ